METPNQIPQLITTHSLQAALDQNEDLQSRLKVALQRLALIEQQMRQAQHLRHQSETALVHIQDQVLVWKEKEALWQLHRESLEKRLGELQTRLPQQEEIISRLRIFERYHRRIQKNVRPYVEGLKNFVEQLTRELRSSRTQLDTKQGQLEVLTQQLQSIRHEHDQEVTRLQRTIADQNQFFEKKMAQLQMEIASLQATEESLKRQCDRLPQALSHADALENQVVALRRERDEIILKLANEQDQVRRQTQKLNQEKSVQQVKLDDLMLQNKKLEEQIKKSTLSQQETAQQLEALRQLWNSKSNEIEKYKISLRSLEKINSDLSRQLLSGRAPTLDI